MASRERAERAQRARPQRRIDSAGAQVLLAARWEGKRRTDLGWYRWTTPVMHGPQRPCVYCGQFVGRRSARVCAQDACRKRYNADRNRPHYAKYSQTEAGRESKRKRNARRRAARLAVSRVEFDAVEVFERDRWICQLCNKRVDRKLRGTHPGSPTIDHILPLTPGRG